MSRTSGSGDQPAGVNRLACRTCPYQFIIEKRYFERRTMKHKEFEDVMGGPGSMDNADRTDGTNNYITLFKRLYQQVL